MSVSQPRGVKNLIPCRSRKGVEHEIPIEHVGLFSYLTYAWLDGLMWKAFRHGLDAKSIWSCPQVDGGQLNAQRLELLWSQELEENGPEKAKLSRVFMKFIRRRLVIAIIVLVFGLAALLFVITYLLLRILSFAYMLDKPEWEGIVYVVALFIGNMLATVLFLAVFSITHIAAVRLRAGVLYMIYKKLLNVVNLQDKTMGEVLNLYANDSQRLFDGISMFPMIFGGPMLGIGATIYAVYLLGPWALVGFAIICLLFPLQGMAGKLFMKFRAQALDQTDKRVRAMNEMLSNVKFIKMNCLEKAFSKIMTGLRAIEHGLLEKVNIAMSVIFLTSTILVAIATMVTLMILTMTGHNVTSVQAFAYIIAYSAIQDKLELCTMTVKYVSEFFVATHRCQETLLLEEASWKGITFRSEESEISIEISNASFQWHQLGIIGTDNEMTTSKEKEKGKKHLRNRAGKTGENSGGGHTSNGFGNNTELEKLHPQTGMDEVHTWKLEDVNCRIERGGLIGITGPVGGGKSALLAAISGQMNILDGNVIVNGCIADVPQKPWIVNDTIRNNILLGDDYQEERYRSVLDACCLVKDLQVLPHGDKTEVGERGVTLSGGQKQRISLARAVYSNRLVYLLDDPLASVDADVAELIYQRVLLDMLVGKTVLFVNNQKKYFTECDQVLFVKGGSIVEQGTPAELLEKNGFYAAFCRSGSEDVVGDSTVAATEYMLETNSDNNFARQLSRQSSGQSSRRKPKRSESMTSPSTELDSLMSEEEKEKGAIGWSTYTSYLKATGGAPAVLAVLIVSLIAEGCRAFSYWWLAEWIKDGSGNTTITAGNETMTSTNISDNPRLRFYNMVYGLSLLGILLFFILRSIILVKVLMRASSRLHDSLLVKVLHSPMPFFDTTPLGRIINRFSRDLDELDAKMPPMIDNTLKSMLSIVLYLVLIGVLIPWFLIAVPVVAVVFVLMYSVFRVGLRELKRELNISMSPLLSHMTASLEGVTSIRLYGKQEAFLTRFHEILNHNTSCMLLYHFSMRWINLRLALVTTTLVCLTALSVVLLRGSMPTEYAGVAIIYAVQLLTLVQLFVRFSVETEATFTSVERIRNYTETLKTEGEMTKTNLAIPNTWPSEGHIRFDNYQLRYRAALPLVLKGITCEIQPRETVGIVGRTGSGKTSLAAAIFRLVEPAGGRVEIDGIDISNVGLQELRSNLSIIPQDPVLFAGTIRTNLDPPRRCLDIELWRALEKCHLKETVEGLEGKLDAPVVENGENFSAGERQLLCMTRILLVRTRILVLDEATASIDSETESFIQEALKEAFSECTLLVIAHRLETVMKCNRILVMEDGKIVEYDKPSVLMEKPDSRFRHMISLMKEGARSASQDSGLDILESEAWV